MKNMLKVIQMGKKKKKNISCKLVASVTKCKK